MSRLVWGDPGKRLYETGIDRGVFYPRDGVGVPWNGLVAVSEAPSGTDIFESHYDGSKFRQHRQSGSFAAKLSAYTYPQEFGEYDGYVSAGHTQQRRKLFNLSYRTKVANDLDSDASYLIHLVYNALASPVAHSFSSIATNDQAAPFEWDLTTVPEFLPTGEVSAHLIIDSRMAYSWAIEALEDILYGTASTNARFPGMFETVQLFEDASILRITDHGDGTWTAEGPDDVVRMLDDTTFEINWPSVVYIDEDTYTVRSL